ncbi:MAG: zinc ribbon domain-containing protein [Sedimentisphaerales bacterium]|nr:zinc ribbon domain-containing protein [Sedimentisphaerales bacterium]
MPFCHKCNIEYEKGKNFCRKCGTPLSPTSYLPYCLKCNLEYEQGDKFCNKCGSPLTIRQKSDQAEAKTQKVPRQSPCANEKGNVWANKFYPLAIIGKQKFNKYLVLLYFIAAGIFFFFSVILYYQRERPIFFSEFVFFTLILASGFFLSKRKTCHLAVNVISSLLLLSYIIYLISFICEYVL